MYANNGNKVVVVFVGYSNALFYLTISSLCVNFSCFELFSLAFARMYIKESIIK